MGLMGLMGGWGGGPKAEWKNTAAAKPLHTEKLKAESRTFGNGGEGNPKTELSGTVAVRMD